MKNFLRKYSEPARIGLTAIGSLLVVLGFTSAASAQLIIGSALAFGVAFWKLYDLVVNKNEDGNAYSELVKIALAAVSTILLTLGIVDGATVEYWVGVILTCITTVWTFISTLRK